MRITQTRMAFPIFIGIAFGVFFTISCASSNVNDSGSSQLSESLQALGDLQNQIEENPADIDLKTEKIKILFEIAQRTPSPALRKPYYQNMYDTARDISYYTDTPSRNVTDQINQAWSFEQSQGITLLQQDSTENLDQYFNSIVAHFDNAITVQPDSMMTYSLKATTLYKHGKIEDAIATLETAADVAGNADTEIEEKLAYLYLESGNIEHAVEIYRQLAQTDMSDTNIQNGLVNAYILNEQHQEAVELLRKLTESHPDRYEYQEALATELYYIFDNESGQWLSNANSSPPETSDIEHLLTILQEVDSIFNTLQTDLLASERTTERMASFYKNAALTSSRLAEITSGNIHEELRETEIDFYNQALSQWQKLTELQPDNIEYQKNLYQIYLVLNMDEEAQAIERSFNF